MAGDLGLRESGGSDGAIFSVVGVHIEVAYQIRQPEPNKSRNFRTLMGSYSISGNTAVMI